MTSTSWGHPRPHPKASEVAAMSYSTSALSSPLSAAPPSVTGGADGGGGATSSGSSGSSPAAVVDHAAQMKVFLAHLTVLNDPSQKDEAKLKAAQELSDNLDALVASPLYQQFLDQAMRVFVKLLRDGRPHFIAEYNVQQVRKQVLEMIQRFPANEFLKPYSKDVLKLAFKLLEFENEENVIVCLRIIIELHKQFRPSHSVEINQFLHFVKSIYKELPNHLSKIFDPRPPIRIKDLNDPQFNIEAVLGETFTVTTITTEKKGPENQANVTYNLIPKAVLSLKVLQELPIIVVLMYQLYKQYVHQDVAEFIPLIMNTITLQPSQAQRAHKDFNKEVFVDFMGAQIKTLSFLAYIIRIYQEVVSTHSTLMVKGMLSLLTVCPHEVAHLRKELLIAARHILATELRIKFVPYMEKLFDESVLLGRGWTTHESLRPLAYSTLADLVHHVRQHLQHSDLARAVQLFSRNVHDESLPTSIQTMSCKLLLNLVECIRARSDQEQVPGGGRELLMRMMEVFVLKFKTVSKLQLPVLMSKHKQQVGAIQQQQLQQQAAASAAAAAGSSSSAAATSATPGTVGPSTLSDTKPTGEDVKPALSPANQQQTGTLHCCLTIVHLMWHRLRSTFCFILQIYFRKSALQDHAHYGISGCIHELVIYGPLWRLNF